MNLGASFDDILNFISFKQFSTFPNLNECILKYLISDEKVEIYKEEFPRGILLNFHVRDSDFENEILAEENMIEKNNNIWSPKYTIEDQNLLFCRKLEDKK